MFSGYIKPNFQIEIDFNVDTELQKKIRIITGVGISEKTAKIIAEKYWKIFSDSKTEMLNNIQNGKLSVESFPAYLIGVLNKKGCGL
jgi:hypothetical protein